MRQKAFILIMILIAMIINTCKDRVVSKVKEIEVTDKEYPIRFVKEKEVKIDVVMAWIPRIFRVDGNNIFMGFFVGEDIWVWRYDADLELEKKFVIPYGQGPGECLAPLPIGGDLNNILVYDPPQDKYYLFDENFNVKETLKSRNNSRTFCFQSTGFSSSKMTVLSVFVTQIDANQSEYEVTTRRIENSKIKETGIYTLKFPWKNKNGSYIMGRPLHCSLINDNIYILKTDEYLIIKMDLEGNILKETKVINLEDKSFSEAERKEWIKASVHNKLNNAIFPEKLWVSCWIIRLKDGIAVGRRNDYNPNNDEWIEADYFDFELNFLGKIKIPPGLPEWNGPASGQRVAEGSIYFNNDRLYVIEYRETENDEEYYLTRWRIEDKGGPSLKK